MDAQVINETLTGFGAGAPLGVVGDIGYSAYSNVGTYGINNGNGVFGQDGLKIGDYKINSFYASKTPGAGTIFSIKQSKLGGNLLRFDYGPMHSSPSDFGYHSTFRFNINNATYGSTAQYPMYAPFTFWKYKQK